MEKYNNILHELNRLFPRATRIMIEIDTNATDLERFSNELKELSSKHFTITAEGAPTKETFTSYVAPNGGCIKLTDNGK